jgi:hypothetical protein
MSFKEESQGMKSCPSITSGFLQVSDKSDNVFSQEGKGGS